MRTLFARATAVAASAMLASAALALPAYADVKTFPDAGGHITAIKVSHAPVNIAVKATDAEMTIETFYTFWLDTDSSDPGPEYKTKIFPDSDGMFLSSVGRDRRRRYQDRLRRVPCSGRYVWTRVCQDHRAAQLRRYAGPGPSHDPGLLRGTRPGHHRLGTRHEEVHRRGERLIATTKGVSYV